MQRAADDHAAPIETDRLELVLLPTVLLGAITDAATGSSLGAIEWPGVGPLEAALLVTIPAALRLGQIRANPEVQPWLVRGIVARDANSSTGRVAIGHIGGHGPPGADGSVEVGYMVAAGWRRTGIATEAAVAWFEWAHRHGARRARLSTTDDNAASLAIARRLGLVHVDRVWDDDDQVWEQVFEADLPLTYR